MDSRRQFISQVAGGLAGTLAVPSSVLGAGERVRFALIGAGERGTQLAREALACPGTELAAVADVYNRRLETARQLAPAAEHFSDYRRILDRKDIDAVVIATPPHLHASQFISAIEAGKHVYIEKTLAFTLDDARLMRAAYDGSRKLTVQVGHQACSSGAMADAVQFLASGRVGAITAIHAHMFRNTPRGKAQWYRPVYPDMTAETIDWTAFQGSVPERPFDANRFVNWRFYWDYSGGNVFENLCHQLAFWYKALDLRIPAAAAMSGGVYLWKDGREVPDTMNVSLEQPEEMLITWDSGFGNNQLGTSEEVLGTDGTISRSQQIRYTPQKVNQPGGAEALGQTRTGPNAHVRNFLDCLRSGQKPNCPFELGYRVSIACRMAVESYMQQRTVRWNAAREEIV
jgi:predicted dehydrogenase